MTWARHGECNHCGHCCTMVAREALVRSPFQVARDPAFYQARGFRHAVIDGDDCLVLWAWLLAPCPEFKDQRCAIQDAKPRTCTEFPRLPAEVVGTPCSYWFENAAGEKAGGTGSPHPTTEAQLLEVEQHG